MASENGELICYNKGCGKTFLAADNKEDSCTHHPGAPFFHDAYKGWSCCNKKCTDFTEFLNFKGCSRSYHSNVKPPEAEKPVVEKLADNEVLEVKSTVAPIPQSMQRPSYDTPMVVLEPTVAAGLVSQMKSLVLNKDSIKTDNPTMEVPLGTSCKNSGCKVSYTGAGDISQCTYHPGYPVFHEGLKYWSCCQRKTSDFDVFLEQQGCKTGNHVWVKERDGDGDRQVNCRMDWHQTGGQVVVSVFAKKYDPSRSRVQLSPVRLAVELFFPEEEATYNLDVELRGVVSVEESRLTMFQTKVEVKLKKAEPSSWSRLDISRPSAPPPTPRPVIVQPTNIDPHIDEPVDLGDL